MELMITAVIGASMIAVAWGLLRLGDRTGVVLSRHSAAAQDVRLRLIRMTHELQEGTRLFWPEPNETSEAGLGFVNARGETILYFLAPADAEGSPDRSSPGGRRMSLWRTNLTLPAAKPEVMIPAMHHFRATTAPRAKGRQPARLGLDVCAGVDDAAAWQVREVNMITSVFLRNLEKVIPDDPTEPSYCEASRTETD